MKMLNLISIYFYEDAFSVAMVAQLMYYASVVLKAIPSAALNE